MLIGRFVGRGRVWRTHKTRPSPRAASLEAVDCARSWDSSKSNRHHVSMANKKTQHYFQPDQTQKKYWSVVRSQSSVALRGPIFVTFVCFCSKTSPPVF